MELKNKTIGDMTRQELILLERRLRSEREVEDQIRRYMIRSSDKWDETTERIKINTKTPINQMYPNGEEFAQKTISELTDGELEMLLRRLNIEADIAYAIDSLRRNSGDDEDQNIRTDYGDAIKINNNTPVKDLYHHGIKDQRWGIRRYQNLDGTLTEAGKRRYGSGSYDNQDNQLRFTNKDGALTKEGSDYIGDVQKVSQISSKTLRDAAKILETTPKSKRVKQDYSKMTNEELQQRVNRLNLEEAYGRLSGETTYKRTGAEWTREILQTAGATVGVVGGALGIYMALKHL